jgi:hypothetical protein
MPLALQFLFATMLFVAALSVPFLILVVAGQLS